MSAHYESEGEREHLLKRFRATHTDVDDFTDEMIESLAAFHWFVLAHRFRNLWGELSAPLVRLADWLEATLRRRR